MIPDYQTLMLPLLVYAKDENEHHIREAIEKLADDFKLTNDERKELLPSGQQSIFDNRVGWAKTYLKKAGLIESPKRGYFKITKNGLTVLDEPPKKINIRFLEQFDGFVEFRLTSTTGKSVSNKSDDKQFEKNTPEELIATGYQEIQQDLAVDLIEHIKKCSPSFFERLVVDLLVKMGYGGSRVDAGKAIGKSGDEGIDGIIKEDKLGLDILYIQAKRWENVVSRPEIQKFAGALQGQRAKKGIFLTTSTFSKNARDYVSKIDNKIVLIDGELLGKLMIEHDVGVSKIASYDIKKIDSDYFIDD